jgi:non-homologous end joining protein Ku
MAQAATKAAVSTTLAIEQVEVEVGLYATTSKPGEVCKFDTAGPNGGKLKYEQRAVATPPKDQEPEAEPTGKADPLAEDPGPELATADRLREMATTAERMAETVETRQDGEFRQVLVEEDTGEVVEPGDVRRGVRLDNGSFIDCTDQLLEIEEQTKLDEMRVVSFIDVGQVPRDRVLASYYVGTNDPGALPALKLLREAMRDARRAAVVRWSSRSRQSLGVIVAGLDPDGRQVLKALKLAWAEDFRPAPNRAQLDGVEVGDAMVEQGHALVRAMSDTRESLDDLRDDALTLREELKARAEAGEMDVQVVEPRFARDETQDVSDALEASLAALK